MGDKKVKLFWDNSLIANLTFNNLALHQQLIVLNRFYQKATNQDQRPLVLDYSLSLLGKLAGVIGCFKTRNGYWLTQKRFRVVLEVEVQIQKPCSSSD
ncbi:MAG: hypothetical protein GY941_29770 [Planctomycetes bacterium]|nr:hypothetical protein [Planctomycetota bacterium]